MSRALAEYAKYSKRDTATLLNQKAYSILIKAAAQNRTADKGKIIAELGQEATAIRAQKVRITKAGVKRGKMITEKIFAPALYAIVQWKAKRAGRVINSSEMEREAQKELSRRISAISFMRSGWLAAIGNIGAAIGKPSRQRKRKAFGSSIAAKPETSPHVSFENTSFDKAHNTTDKDPTRWAREALQKGFVQETANMRQRIAQKLARLG
tara:strand:+ start:81 stop:710 length:630 start_codon:yes stop_codon:yes gene_type:complete